jgi:DNA-binding XRE family transcriptional regulator
MAKTLKQWREERNNMSQMELAVKTGLSLSTISNIESARQEPRLTVVQKIAAALDVCVEDIEWPEVTARPRRSASARAIDTLIEGEGNNPKSEATSVLPAVAF